MILFCATQTRASKGNLMAMLALIPHHHTSSRESGNLRGKAAVGWICFRSDLSSFKSFV